MNDNHSDDQGTGHTRPSAARTLLNTGVMPSGSPITTKFPVVLWGQTGAVLESSELPRYEKLEVLGEGGMGEVVRARDNDIGREVAVKRLKPELQHPEIFARFVEEVRTVGQLEHPNIVPIHDAGVDASGYFFVMKKVEGDTLAAIIARLNAGDPETHRRWPLERRVEVIRKVLEALRYAHSKGVVHRDIKPANVLVGPMGEVFLLDWGIARRQRGVESSPADLASSIQLPVSGSGSALQTQAGLVMGTPLYMSPEQARGEAADERSDLYSLCLTFYELVTLTHPFAHLTDTALVLKAVASRPIPEAALRRHPHQHSAPMDLTHLLRKGVAKDPAKRFQSADELAKRLDDRAEGLVPIQCPITATKRLNYVAMKLVMQHPFIWLGVLTAGLVGAVYGLARLVA